MPIGDSREDLLRYADPAWLEVLQRGLEVALFGLRLFYILVITFLATLIVGTVIETLMHALLWSIVLLIVVAFIIIGIGLWLISTPEPRERDHERASAAYRILSCALVPALGFWCYLAGAQPLVAVHWMLQQVAVHVCFAATIAHAVLMVLHAKRLDRRVPVGEASAQRRLPEVKPFALGIGLTCVVGAYWLLPTVLSVRPGWHLPGDTAQMFFFLFTAMVWFAQLSILLHLRPSIAKERQSASEVRL